MTPSDNPDYYQILGVSQDATFEDIRTAFRDRAREFHPDRNASPDAVDRMQEVNEAYEVLRDAEQRAVYDGAHRKFSATDIEQTQVREIAVIVLGELAYGLGYNIGAGVRSDWMSLVGRIDNIPPNVWHATYEAALESAFENADHGLARQAAIDAAWRAANNEVAGIAYRHALWERSSSLNEALLVAVSTQIVGMIATIVGNQVGRQRINQIPPDQAWLQASDAVREEVLAILTAWSGRLSMSLLADAAWINMVMDRAVSAGSSALSGHMVDIYRRAGRQPIPPDQGTFTTRTSPRESGGGDGGAFAGIIMRIIPLGICAGILWLLGTICTVAGLV